MKKGALKSLPSSPFESSEWSTARVHPDSTIVVEQVFYSAPYLYRGKEVRVKLTQNQIEVIFENERVAIYSRYILGEKGYIVPRQQTTAILHGYHPVFCPREYHYESLSKK